MASSNALIVAVFCLVIAVCSVSVKANFRKSTSFNFGARHSTISTNGNDLQLALDKTTGGSGIQTKKQFLFGSIEMQIKLVPGNSAGTVTTYYLAASGDKHDEIDFEFLGNVSGQPYTIHTNIYTQGNGNREQQFYPWFDPTAAYHNYTIHWNPTAIVWYIDSIPIRVFRNYENEGIPYPNKKGMRVYSTLWNADDWATQGGRVKTDWNKAPFKANYRQFRARACKWNGPVSISQCATRSAANWWTSPVHSQLSYSKKGQMKWIRNKYMVYDYCKDTRRFRGVMPPECSKRQY